MEQFSTGPINKSVCPKFQKKVDRVHVFWPGASEHRGPGAVPPPGRTVPPDEYKENQEIVLQSTAQRTLSCYLLVVIIRTEVPREAIWCHRMQENPSAAGAPPWTPLGAYSAPRLSYRRWRVGWLPPP